MPLDRKAMFAMAKEKRKTEREEESNKSSWSAPEYENTYWMALQTNGTRVFRIVGCPLSARQDCYDPKRVNVARIKGDNGSRFWCIFPDKQTNKDWILWRIYDLVTEGSFVGSGQSRHKQFKYENVHPECFKRVVYNDVENNPYEKGWMPQARVIMNVIDRHDPEFHKNTNHTKLLSSKGNEDKNKPGVFYYDWGVPITCYNTIWDEVVEYSGDWADYDVGVKKLDDAPYYAAYHGVNDAHKIKEVANVVIDGPMTPAEEKYEKYDLDEMFSVTSYTKIKAKLGAFIKKVDFDFGMNFSKELDALVAEEQARWKAEGRNQFGYKNTKSNSHPASATIAKPVEQETPFEDSDVPEYKEEYQDRRVSAAPAPVRAAVIDWDALANGSYNGTEYLGVPEMTDEEKACVLGIKDDGSFIYKPGLQILKNTKNQFCSPSTFHVDPLSGEIWPVE